MENDIFSLKFYPKLQHWYLDKSKHEALSQRLTDRFILKLCASLKNTPEDTLSTFVGDFSFLISNSPSFDEDYQSIDQNLQKMDFSLNQFLGEMSRVAVINSKAGTLYRMMKQAAEQSTNPTFRFLSAWLALNLKDYESCIDQCDRIDYPLAPIYTIHGQALLETNRPKEAIEILEISVELDAGDMFAWFQLAKAYFVIDQFENAWTCLNTCLQQDRSNIEVILMISFIATKAPFREDWLRFASNLLNGQMGQYSDNLTIIKQGLLVATRLNHHESARVLIHHANWRTLKNQPDFLSFLAEILKQFHELEWHDLTINFIDQVEMTQSVN